MSVETRRGFWREAFAWHGSVSSIVMPRVLMFGVIALGTCVLAWVVETSFQIRIGWEVAPFEFVGAALGLILILRTNAGNDRWWEARKIWGGIVNQSRNLALDALAYGPADPQWRNRFVRTVAAFPHVASSSLRGEALPGSVNTLLDSVSAQRIEKAGHRPSAIALQLAEMLHEACDRFGMDRYAFLQIDRERAALIDHIGACERILKTPLPRVYAIKIRRFIVLFLLSVPLALLHRIQSDSLIPLLTMIVAYPLVSLDQIGVELQNPFARSNLSHLPLDDIAATIERNLLGYLEEGSTGRDDPMTRKPPANHAVAIT